ncbi:MAG: hypothetical protein WC785_06310 [Tatlockia sp.]|jgi:hypothetical protein
MSDSKSKMPDFKEISAIAGKLFTDIKKSVSEIMDNYKKKRCPATAKAQPKAEASKRTASTQAAPKVVKKKTTTKKSDSEK